MVDSILTGRNDFLWSSMFHSHYWGAPFKYENIEEAVHIAAKLGQNMIRIDGNSELDWLDKTIKLCNCYGIKVMLIIYIPQRTITEPHKNLALITEYYKNLASRYDGKHGFGKIDFIQLDNELDLPLLHAASEGKPAPNGDLPEHWKNEHLGYVADQLKAAVKGVKESGNDAKTIINFAWKHYGMLKYFYDNGVEWDICGHDWYSDMMAAIEASGSTAYGIGEQIYKLFGKPIILCETNMFGKNEDFDENDASNWDLFIRCMEECYSKDFVIGFSVYELFDELRFDEEANRYNQEAHFGLVYCDLEGNIGEVKPIYRRIQKIIGGDENLPKISIESV